MQSVAVDPVLLAMMRLLTLISALCVLSNRAPAQDIRISMASSPKAPGRAYSSWTVFEHPRFKFELPVPPAVRASGDPGVGRESTFVSGDGAFKMTAWGGLSPQPAGTVLETEWKNARGQAGRTVSYGSKGPDWFVISGLKNGHTSFCEKLIMRGDHVAAFSVSWPKSRTREFADWVKKIDGGFMLISGPGHGVPEIAAHLTSSPGAENDVSANAVGALAPDELRQGELPPTPVTQLETQPAVALYRIRARNSTIVNLTPPPKMFSVDAALETLPAAPGAAASHDTPVPPKEPSPPAPEMATGEPVPGRTGFVYSPFLTDKMLVDAVDLPPGTKVKCPYTGKVFRLP